MPGLAGDDRRGGVAPPPGRLTSRPSATTLIATSRSVMKPTGAPPPSTSTTDPTLRSRISSATVPTGQSGAAVTTDSVMTSRICIGSPSLTLRRSWRSHHRPSSPGAGASRPALAVVAPALDLLLAAGDRLSRAVERDDLDWVPPRRIAARRRAAPAPRARRARAPSEHRRGDAGLGGAVAPARRGRRDHRRRRRHGAAACCSRSPAATGRTSRTASSACRRRSGRRGEPDAEPSRASPSGSPTTAATRRRAVHAQHHPERHRRRSPRSLALSYLFRAARARNPQIGRAVGWSIAAALALYPLGRADPRDRDVDRVLAVRRRRRGGRTPGAQRDIGADGILPAPRCSRSSAPSRSRSASSSSR